MSDFTSGTTVIRKGKVFLDTSPMKITGAAIVKVADHAVVIVTD